jgi:hypothetical protein
VGTRAVAWLLQPFAPAHVVAVELPPPISARVPLARAHAHSLWMAHRHPHRFSPAVFHVVVKDPDTNKRMPLPSVLPEVDDGVEETKGGDGDKETVGGDEEEKTVGGGGDEETVGGDGPVPDAGQSSSPLPIPSTAADGAWLAGVLVSWRAQSCANAYQWRLAPRARCVVALCGKVFPFRRLSLQLHAQYDRVSVCEW